MIEWFLSLFCPRTVDSIVANITKQANELRLLAVRKEDEEYTIEEQLKALFDKKYRTRLEMSRANDVAFKLETLVS